MSPTVKGFLNASISGITFGLIPLFALPVLNTGMHSTSVLIYRYAFGCLAMLGMLMFHRTRMWLAFGDFLRILLLSSMYAVSSITLIEGYNYMPSGIATTLLFSYPVWTCLLSVVFLHEKLSATTAIAIAIAVGGVFFLSGILDGQGDMQGLTGLFLLLTSGFLYANFGPLCHIYARTNRSHRHTQSAYQPLFAGFSTHSHQQRNAHYLAQANK